MTANTKIGLYRLEDKHGESTQKRSSNPTQPGNRSTAPRRTQKKHVSIIYQILRFVKSIKWGRLAVLCLIMAGTHRLIGSAREARIERGYIPTVISVPSVMAPIAPVASLPPIVEEFTETVPAPVDTQAAETEAIIEQAEALPYTETELELLALVIYQEAGGDACSDDTRLMVGTVVLNRVADKRFPDSIYGVITQKAQYGRLYYTGPVWPTRATNPGEAHAVQRAYDLAERLLMGERALPSDVVFQAEFVQGSEVVADQDGMYFCR